MIEITEQFYNIPSLKIKSQYSEVFNKVEDYVITHNINCLNFKQKLYCYINKLKNHVLCSHCNKNYSSFINCIKGYREYCSTKCKANSISNKEKIESTLKNKYGNEIRNISQIKEVKEKKEKTFLEKYGNSNPLKAFDNKIKETLKSNYNVTNPSYSNIIKDKISKANRLVSKKAKLKRRETLLSKYNITNSCYLKHKNKSSKFENELRLLLNGEKKKIENLEFDIHIPNTNILIEVDGYYYHPDLIYDLDITQINSVLNDIKKTQIAKENGYELYRIRETKNIKNLEDVIKNQYTPNYNVDFDTIITSKEKLKKYIAVKGIDKLERYLDIYLKFFRTFFPKFIFPLKTSINFKFTPTIVKNKTFINSNNTGNKFLKSIFHSYYFSSYKGNVSPAFLYKDDNFLKNIIKYRIGINNYDEVYDLSFNNILIGMSAIRKTISFFKPSIAYSIYNYFITSTDTPIVLDPCCGFGGRMLGFFSRFSKGKYVGCEPNPQTFSELLVLKNEISKHLGFEIDCEIYNITIEEFVARNLHKNEIDFTFTSIPYYDKEIYSKDIVKEYYSSFEDWKDKFLSCFNYLPNCYLNLPKELFDNSGLKNLDLYFLKNSVAKHLNKTVDEKIEYIVKVS